MLAAISTKLQKIARVDAQLQCYLIDHEDSNPAAETLWHINTTT
jgi:hypothetical protein